MKQIIIADPAGNLTAIVRTDEQIDKKEISTQILDSGIAEQVGFEQTPVNGGNCALTMMGGEFCGNATRSMGYLWAKEHYAEGQYIVMVEISGAADPVKVIADLDLHESYADMPLPIGYFFANVDEQLYPVVHMEGIDHMILFDKEPDETFAEKAIAAMKDACDACGVMFVNRKGSKWSLTPVVYVKVTDSTVWESSCGSGSVAAAWYIENSLPMPASGEYLFHEPKGDLSVKIHVENGGITRCFMGGTIDFATCV